LPLLSARTSTGYRGTKCRGKMVKCAPNYSWELAGATQSQLSV